MIRSGLFILFAGILLVVIPGKHVFAYTAYSFQNHDLDVFLSSPPALIFVTDSQSDMTGADPSKGIDSFGRGIVVQGIPNSYVEQVNIGSDAAVPVPHATTGWSINMLDHPAESYIVNLQGVATGICQLWISGLYAPSLKTKKIRNELFILVTSGITKQIQVTFDPTAKSLVTAPIITGGNFLQDTQSACQLGDISPAEACEVLEAIASEVEKSISKGNASAEAIELNLYLLVLNQLHNWGNAGSIQSWGNFNGYSECLPLCNKGLNGANFFAKNPAYSALELDAQTLLNALSKQGISQGGGNQGGGNQGGNQGYGQGSNGNQGSGGNQGGQGNQGGGNQGNH